MDIGSNQKAGQFWKKAFLTSTVKLDLFNWIDHRTGIFFAKVFIDS